MRNRAALVLAATFIVVFAAPVAQAHANYLSSEPARGARLLIAPQEIRVTLTEEIDASGSSLELRGIEGGVVATSATRITGTDHPVLTIRVTDLPAGAYTVTWKALSTVDGHVTGGTFGFAVGGFDPPAEQAVVEDLAPLSALARALTYAGYAAAFGSLATIFVYARGVTLPWRRPVAGRAAWAGCFAIATGASILLLDTARDSGFGVLDFIVATDVGRDLAFRIAYSLLAGIVAAFAARSWRWAPWGVVLGLLLVTAWNNATFVHSANQGLFAVANDFLHLVSVSVWLGGLGFFLASVALLSRTGDEEGIRRIGIRFSRLALTSVAVLATTGVFSAVLIVGWSTVLNPFQLVSSAYGRFLAGKVVLAAFMVGLASVNRFIFLGKRPGRDDDAGGDASSRTRRARRFGATVAGEVSLGAIVVILAGFLTAISPPLGEDVAVDASLRVSGTSRELAIQMTIDPAPVAGAASNVSFEIVERDTFAPITEAQTIQVFLVPDADPEFGDQSFLAEATPDGRWTIGEVFFTHAGNTTARVEVSTDFLYRDTTEISFVVSHAVVA